MRCWPKALLLVAFVPGCSRVDSATPTVCPSGCLYTDLQTAINEAQPGDTIVLEAGQTYRGNFELPWKDGEQYITIQSSRADELPPPGYRVTPDHAPLMARLEQASRAVPVVRTEAEEINVSSIDPETDALTLAGRHRFKEGDPIQCRAEVMPAGLEPYTRYWVRDVVGPTLKLARTPGDAPVDFASSDAGKNLRCSNVRVGHHYRFRGIEFAPAEGQNSEYTLVLIGNGLEMTRDAVPHHFEFLQVYIHGHSTREQPFNGPRVCLALNGAHLSIKDSYISECKREGEEGKAITAWQAPGPLEIRNNYIEGASLNVLFGGAATAIPDHIIGDGDGTGEGGGVAIIGNHFNKQLYWRYQAGNAGPTVPQGRCAPNSFYLETASGRLYACADDGSSWRVAPSCVEGEYFRRADVPQNCASGACWVCSEGVFRQVSSPYRGGSYVIKALFEAKSLKNGVIVGNVFENSWEWAIQLPMQVLNPGYNWNRVEDVIFLNNIVRNSTRGYHNASEGLQRFTKPNRRVRVINNLFYAISMTQTPAMRMASARPLQFAGECMDCVFEHNTILSGSKVGGQAVIFTTAPLTGFRFANNIGHANMWGIFGDGGVGGNCAAIERYTPGAFHNNIFINDTGTFRNGSVGPCAPTTKYIAPDTELFVARYDASDPQLAPPSSFRLSVASPYSASCTRNCDFTATTGKDLGADIEEIEAATSGAIDGRPSWAERMQLRLTPQPRQAVLEYEAPSDEACKVRLFTNAARTALHPDTATVEAQSDGRSSSRNDGRRRRFLLGAQSPLAPGTPHWYSVQCGRWLVPGFFQTPNQ